MTKNRIEVTCIDCGTRFTVCKSTYNKHAKNDGKTLIFRCKSCRIEYHKSYYDRMDPDKKKIVHNIMSAKATVRMIVIKNDPEKYKKWCEALSKADKKYWSNASEETHRKRSASLVERWANISDEKRKAFGENQSRIKKEWWANRSEEEMEYWREFFSKIGQSYWDNATPEELEKRSINTSNRFKNWWDNMSPEEYILWKKNHAEGFRKYIERIHSFPNKNESSFINYLNIDKIDYTWHYFNTTYPSNFKENFPHNPTKTDYFVKYFTGEKFKLNDLIKFNDSQRPYQTDGLDAYIIQCYDDKLTDDTPVVKIQTGEKMSFKSFMALIEFMNNKV